MGKGNFCWFRARASDRKSVDVAKSDMEMAFRWRIGSSKVCVADYVGEVLRVGLVSN